MATEHNPTEFENEFVLDDSDLDDLNLDEELSLDEAGSGEGADDLDFGDLDLDEGVGGGDDLDDLDLGDLDAGGAEAAGGDDLNDMDLGDLGGEEPGDLDLGGDLDSGGEAQAASGAGDGLDDLAGGDDDDLNLDLSDDDLDLDLEDTSGLEMADEGNAGGGAGLDNLDMNIPEDELDDLDDLGIEEPGELALPGDAGQDELSGEAYEQQLEAELDAFDEEEQGDVADETELEAEDAAELSAMDEETINLDLSGNAPVEAPNEPFVAAEDVDLDDIDLDLGPETPAEMGLDEPEELDMDAIEPQAGRGGEAAAAAAGAGMGAAAAGMAGGGRSHGNVRPIDAQEALEVPFPPNEEPQPASISGFASGERRAQPPQTGQSAGPQQAGALSLDSNVLMSVPHHINVQMGTVSLPGRDVLNLTYGSVVQLNKTVGEPVDLMLEGRHIGQGEVVLINGKTLGVRIVSLDK